MITAACDACGKIHRVPDESAGRKAKCGCGTIFSIPIQANQRAVEAIAVQPTAIRHPGTQPTPVTSAPTEGVEHLSTYAKAVIAFGIVAAVGMVAFLVYIYFAQIRPQRLMAQWEDQHRVQITSLANRVQAFRAGADPSDAKSASLELTHLLGNRTVADPTLSGVVADASTKEADIDAAVRKAEQVAEAKKAEEARKAAAEEAKLAQQKQRDAEAQQAAQASADEAKKDAEDFKSDPAAHFEKFARRFVEAAGKEIVNNKFLSGIGNDYTVNVEATNNLTTPYVGVIEGATVDRNTGKVLPFRLSFGASRGRWQLRTAEAKDFLEATLHGRDAWEMVRIDRAYDGLWSQTAIDTGSK